MAELASRTAGASAFERVRSHAIEALRVTLHEFVHRVTGAVHYHLEADDDNNVFLVAFRTVPQDSTGVAHILEHTVLCGSRKFPVRDPFFMMLRRSLNTFMNAFTASDWTAYPFASCNRKDFDNLLEVYLDAAFFPRLHELDFAQEGWRLEFEKPDDPSTPLTYRGVVYNEMKGAMSAPTARLWQSLQSGLFPTTTYHYNSGGEPDEIPHLTYEALKAFHARHYHPSNAVFVTYGNFPVAEHQDRIERWALSQFDRLDVRFEVPDERRYLEPQRITVPYAVAGPDELERHTHVVLGWLLGRTIEVDELLREHLLAGVLLDNSAAPLRHALETSELGSAPSEVCGLEDSLREGVFAAGLEGSEPERAEAVERLVLDTLEQVAERGVAKEMVEVALDRLEMAQRDVRGGYPYGLQLAMRMLPASLHRADPVAVLDIDAPLVELRRVAADPAFIRSQVAKRLLDNAHRVRLEMVPDATLAERREQELAAELASIRAGLDDEACRALVERAAALAERQRDPGDPEALPKVGLADVDPDVRVVSGEQLRAGRWPLAWYARGTNGLLHTHLVVALPELDREDAALLGLLTEFYTEVGAGDADYLQMQLAQARAGQLGASCSVDGAIDDVHALSGWFALTAKGLARKRDPLVDVLHRLAAGVRFDELERLADLVAQSRAEAEASITGRGHQLAMLAAAADLAPTAWLADQWDGMVAVRRLKELEEAMAQRPGREALATRLAALAGRLAGGEVRLLAVAEAGERDPLRRALEEAFGDYGGAGAQAGAFRLEHATRRRRQAWITASEVNFCARAYATVAPDHADAAPLAVLGKLLHNGYLHRAIREQGGAYGSGALYDGDSGTFRFFSYRDPRLEETLADFDRSLEWLHEPRQPRELEEAVLGVVRQLDQPSSPAGEAIRAFYDELHGRDVDFRRRYRNRVLAVTLEDLRRVADRYLDPAAASTAVITGPHGRDAAAALGLTIEEL